MSDQGWLGAGQTSSAVPARARRDLEEAPALCPTCLQRLSPSAGAIVYPEGLTATERLFWKALASNVGHIVPHARFADYHRAYHCGQTMKRLRAKVPGRRIITCHGLGYMLAPEEPATP